MFVDPSGVDVSGSALRFLSARLRNGHARARLAAGSGAGITTAYGYVTEAGELPAALAPALAEAATGRVPRPVAEMSASMPAALAHGRGVQIVRVDAEPTPQQAADVLNVSRPYLIGLLESGEIPFRLVGRHRRVRFADPRQYLREDDARRKGAADGLMETDQELGLLWHGFCRDLRRMRLVPRHAA